jgi:hypothetical protein
MSDKYVDDARTPWEARYYPSRYLTIRSNGASLFHAVADELNRQGITTTRGQAW